MLSADTQQRLMTLLLALAEWERRLEAGRVALAAVDDFEPYSCFTALDRFSQGYLTSADLQVFMRTKGVDMPEKAAFHLVKTLDSNCDGKITYHDFLRFILPSSKVYLSTIAVSRRVRRDGLFGLAEKQLFALFTLQIEANTSINRLRESLWSRSDFSLLEGFRWLDELETGYVSELALGNVMGKAGVREGAREIVRRYDSDNDGKLGYLDYVELVTPSQPLYREVSTSIKSTRSTTPSPLKSHYSLPSSTSPKKKPPQHHSFELISDLFKLQCDLSRKLEKNKEELALKPDFTLARLFKCLKKRGKWIPLEGLLSVLGEIGMEMNEEDLFLMVGTVEVVFTGQLSAKDITDLILPKQIDYARLLTTRICDLPAHFTPSDFSSDTLTSLFSVFSSTLEARKTIEICKQRLISYSDFHPSEAFSILDSGKTGKISIDQLHSALERFGVFAANRDLMGLFWSYDANQDGTISYAEFVKAVTPRLTVPRKGEEVTS